MGLDASDVIMKQWIREGKIRLARLVENKRAEARNLHTSDTTIGRWLDVDRLGENMPWQLVTKISNAEELVADMAYELGKVLVEPIDMGELNGCLLDERDAILVLLGKLTEKLQKAHTDYGSPGRIDAWEAQKLLPIARELERAAVTAVAELRQVIEEGA